MTWLNTHIPQWQGLGVGLLYLAFCGLVIWIIQARTRVKDETDADEDES